MAGKTRSISPAIELDVLIHERVRLAILTALGAHGQLSFNELKGLTGATDGNLSTHTARLEGAGYIRAIKSLLGRRARTSYCITEAGQKALQGYLDQLARIMNQVRQPEQENTP
jgi:DNA-binding MarR family transcriptional regulator